MRARCRCVNNEYCVLFKKGAFDLGARVYPVAIKYNKIFVDAFWNSKRQSFSQHLYRLMTSWAVRATTILLEFLPARNSSVVLRERGRRARRARELPHQHRLSMRRTAVEHSRRTHTPLRVPFSRLGKVSGLAGVSIRPAGYPWGVTSCREASSTD
jgi:hypothetical protein